ncbi:hypothetical protein ACSS6N_25900 [Peribacillus frigoritolerans]|uniref:hypothetical protein n=1 Tax=Peribacillus frigoritolerans TaxID=450367 RepID=UPI003F87880E
MHTVIFLQKNKPDGLFKTVDKLEEKPVCLQFLFKNIPIDIRNPLPADSLPGHLTASGCGVLASQLFGRNIANFFNPIRITVKNH